MKHSDVYALILMGGRSTRFGFPKGMVAIHGKPQWVYMYELLIDRCEQVFFSLTKETRSLYSDIPESDIIYDSDGDAGAVGPMGGLSAALKYNANVSWLVVSVDLFFLDVETVDLLLGSRDKGWDVVAYYYQVLQPLCSIYEPSSYKTIQRKIVQKKFGLKDLIPELIPVLIDGNQLTGNPHPLSHINTIDELQKYQRISRL